MTLLAAHSVCKQFPGTLALNQVDFAVSPGEVHVLVGENGAGKSTLMRILAGIDHPTSGRLENRAGAAGVAMIHQELNVLPDLSVSDNIFLGRERTRFGLLDQAAQQRETAAWLARLEQPIRPTARAGQLPLGQQQIVEIVKALARDVRVLIMDEPTSALSAAEIAILFRLIRDLKTRGVGIVYASHKMEELLTIGDSLTVLRDGRVVATSAAADATLPWIVEKMTGRASHATTVGPPETAAAEPILQAQLPGCAFSVAPGEIVGFYGLLGSGRTELFETLMGLRPSRRGAVRLGGRDLYRADIPARIRAGLAMVSEDRKAAGIIPLLSVRENITLASPASEHGRAAEFVNELAIRCAGLEAPVRSLSGGNQQKVVLARYLMASPKVLLLDEPTRGVDVGAREEIHSIIRRATARGLAVLFATTDLEEILALATRILVLSRGHIAARFSRAEASPERLVAACGGASVN